MRSTAAKDIRTHEGQLHLVVVIDLFSCLVVGWSMKYRITTDLVLDALLMSLWLRKPQNKALRHSDQGSQYTSHEWQTFLKQHNLECSMSRRGNCHDNAVAESSFQLLKRENQKENNSCYNWMFLEGKIMFKKIVRLAFEVQHHVVAIIPDSDF